MFKVMDRDKSIAYCRNQADADSIAAALEYQGQLTDALTQLLEYATAPESVTAKARGVLDKLAKQEKANNANA